MKKIENGYSKLNVIKIVFAYAEGFTGILLATVLLPFVTFFLLVPAMEGNDLYWFQK